MMNSARHLASRTMPPLIDDPKTGKQKLQNDVIGFLKDKGCVWQGSEIENSGKSLIRTLVDVFWSIDGHHDTFSSRTCPIPALFHCFSGYNVPENSKHRKCTIDNLSCTALRSCADALFGCLQGVYWTRKNWQEFKSSFGKLAKSISDYASYLSKQSVVSKRLHLFTHPVRQIADNLSFQITSSGNRGFQELESKLMNAELFEYVVLETVCPQDPRKKYEFIQSLKLHGLTTRCALLTYAHGNYIGNTYFVWKVCDVRMHFHLVNKLLKWPKKIYLYFTLGQ